MKFFDATFNHDGNVKKCLLKRLLRWFDNNNNYYYYYIIIIKYNDN